MIKTNTNRRQSLSIAVVLNLNQTFLLGCFALGKPFQKPELGRKTPSLLPRLSETNPRKDEQLGFGYTARCFERTFQRTRASFVRFLEIVQSHLKKNFKSEQRLNNALIALNVRLVITFRVLSGRSTKKLPTHRELNSYLLIICSMRPPWLL